MSRIVDFIADIFMPNRCPCCDRFIRWDELVCKRCQKELPLFREHDIKPPEGCSAAVCAFRYEGIAKQGIYSLKNGCGKNFALYSARVLAPKVKGAEADLITCVPMSRRKKAERGYNQAELIARELSVQTGVPWDFKLLARKPKSLRQHDLSAEQRREFAPTIFYAICEPQRVRGKRILLVDDVHTTGSTLSACASLLIGLGASDVVSVAVCRTLKKPRSGREIRRITAAELPLLTELFDYADPDEMIRQNTREMNAGELDIFVMFEGSKPIGELHAACKSADERAEEGKRAYLYAFRIREGYRGRGAGKQLMEQVIGELEDRGYTEFTVGCEDGNDRARHIYEGFGFTELIARKYEEYQGDGYEFGLYLRRDKNG